MKAQIFTVNAGHLHGLTLPTRASGSGPHEGYLSQSSGNLAWNSGTACSEPHTAIHSHSSRMHSCTLSQHFPHAILNHERRNERKNQRARLWSCNGRCSASYSGVSNTRLFHEPCLAPALLRISARVPRRPSLISTNGTVPRVHVATSRATSEAMDAPSEVLSKEKPDTAADVILKFYDAINRRDVEEAMEFIAAKCIYEDMIYSKPFRGREEIRRHFTAVLETVPRDFVFVVDDITQGVSEATGMVWHAEVDGKPFPFSRGCSFYRCQLEDGLLRITYARDIPEPASKPGSSALTILKYVALLFKRFPQIQDRLNS